MNTSKPLLQKVDALLGVELTAVQQHFIHVLLLQSWNENEFSKGIIAIDELDPMSDIHASAEYRRDLARAMIRRALKQALNR